jgi:hypothetical protein
MNDLIKQILKTTTYRSLDVEAILDPKLESWCSFDPEIGNEPGKQYRWYTGYFSGFG